MKRPITPGQRRVLDFLRDFHAQNDQLPPIQAIAAHFGWASWNAAQTHIMGLVRRGYDPASHSSAAGAGGQIG